MSRFETFNALREALEQLRQNSESPEHRALTRECQRAVVSFARMHEFSSLHAYKGIVEAAQALIGALTQAGLPVPAELAEAVHPGMHRTQGEDKLQQGLWRVVEELDRMHADLPPPARMCASYLHKSLTMLQAANAHAQQVQEALNAASHVIEGVVATLLHAVADEVHTYNGASRLQLGLTSLALGVITPAPAPEALLAEARREIAREEEGKRAAHAAQLAAKFPEPEPSKVLTFEDLERLREGILSSAPAVEMAPPVSTGPEAIVPTPLQQQVDDLAKEIGSLKVLVQELTRAQARWA